MKTLYIIIGLLIIGVLGAGLYFFFPTSFPLFSSSDEQEREPYVVPPLGETYTNDEYRFSVILPEGFGARSGENEFGGDTVVLEDDSANGVQIIISPFDEAPEGKGYVLTAERITQDLPDMTIADTQSVEVGENNKGIAFKSDNPAFDGASREVWFVFRGNLYQISTYERLDELLKTMFGTWRFF